MSVAVDSHVEFNWFSSFIYLLIKFICEADIGGYRLSMLGSWI